MRTPTPRALLTRAQTPRDPVPGRLTGFTGLAGFTGLTDPAGTTASLRGLRRPIGWGAALVLAVALTACTDEPELPSPDGAAAALAAGLASGELDGVEWRDGSAGSDSADSAEGAAGAAADELAAIIEPMDGAAYTVTARAGDPVPAGEGGAGEDGAEGDSDEDAGGSDDAASAPVMLEWAWDLGGHTWKYQTQTRLTLAGQRWQASWSPELVEPTLIEGAVLDRVTLAAARGPITGQDGVPLVTRRPVVRVGIDRTGVPAEQAAASGRALAKLLGIRARPYADSVARAGDAAFVEAIVYRQDDVPAQVADLSSIPGARAIADEAVLGPSAEFAAPLLGRVGSVTAEMVETGEYEVGDVAGLSGLSARYDEQLRGTDGVSVDVVASDGKGREVYRVDGIDGEALATTLNENLQFAAERALNTAAGGAGVGASALVAIRPSDGAIVAAANSEGTGGVNLATFGQAAPGSTFKPISALALLRAGLRADSAVDCPQTITVDGKRFSNYDDYPPARLGRITLRAALANSCNTAFAGNAEKVGAGGLADAAASLGLGIDHDLGFPAYFGQVPGSAAGTGLAAAAIGQGEVLASPMAMATVAASVVAGRTVVPRLIETVAVEVPGQAEPLAPGEAKALRSMMRATVTEGPTGFLGDIPGPPVIAKTGTAEFDRDGVRLKHAWLIAGRGDLAVAVYVDEGASGSGTAGPIMAEFLRSAG